MTACSVIAIKIRDLIVGNLGALEWWHGAHGGVAWHLAIVRADLARLAHKLGQQDDAWTDAARTWKQRHDDLAEAGRRNFDRIEELERENTELKSMLAELRAKGGDPP